MDINVYYLTLNLAELRDRIAGETRKRQKNSKVKDAMLSLLIFMVKKGERELDSNQ